ncbi:hypothetical protein BS47DRAFT_1362379 [Hydnum rufescens UP504]|uniref:CxC2-like cysteine cluster KDZ transposase-associated domain-containing protein n=1 Tax=Hydnum rufescens UP504 TaxID=1448309 RepID=A0A9P6DX55_9AGAM|nr:hypothetical protein BS47DRAFT_1362379 [Hydnum rufescens UP504]
MSFGEFCSASLHLDVCPFSVDLHPMSTRKRRGRPLDTPTISVHPSAPHDVPTIAHHFGTTLDGHNMISTRHIIVENESPALGPSEPMLSGQAADGGDSFNNELGFVHYIRLTSQWKRYKAADEPLNEWIPLRSEFLDEMLWNDGCGDSLTIMGCLGCQEPGSSGVYRCEGVFWRRTILPGMLCKAAPEAASPSDQEVGSCAAVPLHPICINNLCGISGFQPLFINPKRARHFKYYVTSTFSHSSPRYLQSTSTMHSSERPKMLVLRHHLELAVLCPACPHPLINLPNDWSSTPAHMKFLYSLTLAIDANFHLKNSLGSGWAYFVENQEYKKYIAQHVTEKDISTCSGLAALNHANMKSSKGLCITGVVASTCARHGFLLPQGLGDLQKGQTDGEGVEHDWAIMNAAANSTKEMSEGSCHDTLDDLWGDRNYQKIMYLGKTLFKKHDTAVIEWAKQSKQFKLFMECLKSDDVEKWEASVRQWECDPSKPNPYIIKSSYDILNPLIYVVFAVKTQADICLKLASAEQQSLCVGTMESIHEMSPSMFISAGLEIEVHHTISIIHTTFRIQKPASDLGKPPTLLPSYTELFVLSPTLSSINVMRAQAQIDAVIESYNVAQKAYHQLVGSGIWEETIQVLHPWDVCAMDDSEGHLVQLGEGYRTLSWIWMAPGLRAMGDTVGTPEMHEALRIEWAKCHTHRNQWVKEELLVKEEIWHTIAFYLLDGVRAYAYYQAALQHDRATSFRVLFSSALDILESMSENDKPFNQDALALSGHGTDEDLDDKPNDDLDDLEI